MVKNNEQAESTVTVKRKTIVTAGWVAGGVLALGATFAAGAAFGHDIDGHRGGDFASGQPGLMGGPGQRGQIGDHGDGDGEYDDGPGGHGSHDSDTDGPGEHGMMAPPAPGAPNDGSTQPLPQTTP